MKKLSIVALVFALIILNIVALCPKQTVFASEEIDIGCKSYILIDKCSNAILTEKNSDERLPVASITKLMTILLTLEEIEKGNISIDTKINVSENASGMGGSQIFLDANCEYSVGDLLKSVIVCSANDSSVALAEYISGTEQLFVKEMNEKAKELNMFNTNYENSTGLPSPNQYSSAKDVAIVLREVIDYPLYQTYSKIWLENFVHPSGRTTEMTNTNKLSRFYEGCLGGKTGSTNEAKYCLAVGAKRNDMNLIAVTLGNENSKDRFNNSRKLLDYGFANYESRTIFSQENLKDKTIKMKGQDKVLNLVAERDVSITLKKGEEIKTTYNYNLPSSLTSVKKDEIVGNVEIIVNGKLYETVNLHATETINEPTFLDYLKRIQKDFV